MASRIVNSPKVHVAYGVSKADADVQYLTFRMAVEVAVYMEKIQINSISSG